MEVNSNPGDGDINRSGTGAQKSSQWEKSTPGIGRRAKLHFDIVAEGLPAGRQEQKQTLNVKHCYDNRVWKFLNNVQKSSELWSNRMKWMNRKQSQRHSPAEWTCLLQITLFNYIINLNLIPEQDPDFVPGNKQEWNVKRPCSVSFNVALSLCSNCLKGR